jgi:Calx-beta domain
MAGFCVVTEIYHVSPARNPSFMQQSPFFLQSATQVNGNGTSGNGGAIAMNGTNINIIGDISTYAATGNGTVGNGGAIDLRAANNLDVRAINNLTSGTVNYGNITLTGNEINLNGGANTVRGNNRNLILQSSTPSQVIQIGGADSGNASVLDITATDLAAIVDGFSQITIGRSDGTGNININSNLNFSDPILLRTPGGQININATVGLTGNSNLNFSASSPANLNTGGAIVLNVNEQIANTADFNLNGGTLNLGGFDETLDLLQLSGNSSINFGNGDSDIVFSNSSGQTWTGLLTINNWSNASGETLRFGTNASGLTPAQLAQIQFTGFNIGASIDSLGFVTPFVAPPVNLSVSANAGTEAGTTAITVTATTANAVRGDQTVSLGVTGTNITAGDYTLSNSTITIPNGQTTGSVTFTVVDDNLTETTETATLTISSPSTGIVLGTTTTQGITITDNDPAGITVNPTTGLVTTEAGGTATFTVVLTSQPTADVAIPLSSSDTTEGTVLPTSLTFTAANWDTPQTVTVTGVDDPIVDGNIAYNILTGAATSADASYNNFNAADVAVTNNDNDVAPNPTVNLSVVPSAGTEAGTTLITVTATASSAVTGDQTIDL